MIVMNSHASVANPTLTAAEPSESTDRSRPDAVDVERELLSRELSGQYQVVRLLGRGGMGSVYLARDLALHRLVAIKTLRHDLTRGADERERFRRGARVTARLSHPAIVPVYGFGETPDLMYIVMKYVHGESLADRLRREGRLSAEEARGLLAELAHALDYAHREGVVHRDLKPENILLERESGRPVLVDFGVASLRSLDPAYAEAGRAFGTPHYMSPEQAAGELDVDGRSDLYALGVIGYQLLTGRVPFDGRGFAEIAAKHVTQTPPPLKELAPRAPAALVAAIERCLAKDPAERWRRGRDLHAALMAVGGRARWVWPKLVALRAAVL